MMAFNPELLFAPGGINDAVEVYVLGSKKATAVDNRNIESVAI
jgi:hypothetical protein